MAQFEKLWGDMTALAEVGTRFVVVPRERGQQLKDVAQLDGWVRDGSVSYVQRLADFQLQVVVIPGLQKKFIDMAFVDRLGQHRQRVSRGELVAGAARAAVRDARAGGNPGRISS